MRIYLVLRYLLNSKRLSVFAISGKKLFPQPEEPATASSFEIDLEDKVTELNVAVGFYHFNDIVYPIPLRILDSSKTYFVLNNLAAESEFLIPITFAKDPANSMNMAQQNSVLLGDTWFSLWKND